MSKKAYRERINEWKGIKVGEPFIITKKPSMWSSGLNDNCPLYETYPYKGVIQAIEIDGIDKSRIINMTDGKYGWALDTLVKERKIKCLRVERRNKLKKIANENK